MSEADEYGPGGDRESGPQSEDAIRRNTNRCEKCEPQAVYAARSHGDKLSVDLVSAWDALRRRLDIAESQILALHWHTYERLLHGE